MNKSQTLLWKCTVIFVLVLLIAQATCYFASISENVNRNCFCELKGSINDCSCNIDTVDHFNNMKIYPRLQSLLLKNYFRFYKVNLKQDCPFWRDDSKCAMRFCHVESCEERDIPKGIVEDQFIEEIPVYKYTKEISSRCSEDFNQELSYLNTSISPQAHKEFEKWAVYDEQEEDFCILDDLQNGAEYVDLLLNPERYTGYKGESAHRIWRTIYLENCFDANGNEKSQFLLNSDMQNVCMEQRAFYRLISGLHSSINIHLCSKYLLSESNSFLDPRGVWGHNTKEFIRRFEPDSTNNQGPHWLKNLYFIYLVELRAIAKAAPYLLQESYYTGVPDEDEEVKMAITDLLNVARSFPSHFDESVMFSSGYVSIKLKNDFREKFRNISRIMDCVGCDKCRLWGKLQTQGLGTALKILYSEKLNIATENGQWSKFDDNNPIFRLKRTEIVALFNAFGRLSNSIYELENFRKAMS